MDTADFPTEMGSPIYRGFRPRGDAAVVMALKQAGATIVGKTTTTAFASIGSDGDAQSAQSRPHARRIVVGLGGGGGGRHDPARAGDADRRLGDPAGARSAACAAIKPSYRLLPTVGVKCYSWTLDTVGLFAAGVDDVARGLAAMTGRPELLLPSSIRRRRASAS